MSLDTRSFDFRWGAKQRDPDRIIIRVPLWSEWRDSNARLPHPKCGALPTGLHPEIQMLGYYTSFIDLTQVIYPVCPRRLHFIRATARSLQYKMAGRALVCWQRPGWCPPAPPPGPPHSRGPPAPSLFLKIFVTSLISIIFYLQQKTVLTNVRTGYKISWYHLASRHSCPSRL